MNNKPKVIKPVPISGFPEWLPEVRRAEQLWQDTARRVFERYGFCNIETPSVEAVEILAAKGVVDKEIYTITRLQADEADKGNERLALHFDQTVPLARYVAQHFNDLAFPFKRYQMQRVWRGDRPQDGRFREFYQYDVDVIAVDSLPLHFDAEMVLVMWELVQELPGLHTSDIQIHISNRKIIEGYLKSIGFLDSEKRRQLIRILDKYEKISEENFNAELGVVCENNQQINDVKFFKDCAVNLMVAFTAGGYSQLEGTKEALQNRIIYNDCYDSKNFEAGFEELEFVFRVVNELVPARSLLANLLMVRGLDYYTGTVYEAKLLSHPDFGSVIAGGRYDDLASSYINKKLPGVGISLGATRLFSKLLKDGKLPALSPSPTEVLVTLPSEEMRGAAQDIAQILRARGINAEVYHASQKFDRQMAYANKKQIPFVWFPDSGQVKNMTTGEQAAADAKSWTA